MKFKKREKQSRALRGVDATCQGARMRPLPGAYAQADNRYQFETADDLTGDHIARMLSGDFEGSAPSVRYERDGARAIVSVPVASLPDARHASLTTGDVFAAIMRTHEMLHVRVGPERFGVSKRFDADTNDSVAILSAAFGRDVLGMVEDNIVNNLLWGLQRSLLRDVTNHQIDDAITAADVGQCLVAQRGRNGEQPLDVRMREQVESMLNAGKSKDDITHAVVTGTAKMMLDVICGAHVARGMLHAQVATSARQPIRFALWGDGDVRELDAIKRDHRAIGEYITTCYDVLAALGDVLDTYGLDLGAIGTTWDSITAAVALSADAVLSGSGCTSRYCRVSPSQLLTTAQRDAQRAVMVQSLIKDAARLIAIALLPKAEPATQPTKPRERNRDDTAVDGEAHDDGDGDLAADDLPELMLPALRGGKSTRAYVRRPSCEGDAVGDVARIVSDGAVFEQRKRVSGRGGTLLIDNSGSMRLEPKDVERLSKLWAHGRVYVDGYSPRGLYLVADKGRYALGDAFSCRSGVNDADLALAQWLARQPMPRVWVTDCIFQAKHGATNAKYLQAVQQAIARGRIRVVSTVQGAIAMATASRV